MARVTSNAQSFKLPRRSGESKHIEFFGREPKGVVECPQCHNVHYHKRWYPSMLDLETHSDKPLEISEMRMCPACWMIENHLFEGEVIAEGFPEELRSELRNLIENYGDRAKEQDPQDRLIKVTKLETGYHILTTENQLADRLGKKIQETFSKVELSMSHSKEPFEVDRVRVTYQEDK